MNVSLLQIRNPSVNGDAAKYAITHISEGEKLPGVKDMSPLIFETPEECFEALHTGQVSMAFVNTYSANVLRTDSRYASFESTALQGLEIKIRLAFPQYSDPRLISIANKALASIDASEINEIILRNTIIGRSMDFETLLRENPITAIIILASFFILVIIAIIYISGIKQHRLEREKNAQLREALTLAEQASAAKGDFMSRMSHEIRTPLNAIIGYNMIAQSAVADAKNEAERKQANMNVMDCLSKSEIASKHLLTVINDVLDMSAIESGKFKIVCERFDFKNLISSITTLFYSQAKANGINMEVLFDSPTEEWYIGDQMRINQILTNLLSNAIKFTPNGGKVVMRIASKNADDEHSGLRFVISDTGIGMKQDFLENLWTPFEQADSSISRRFGGTGLGLSITKSLVDLMGGAISVKSEQDKGSTFTVDLLLERTEQPVNHRTYDFSSINALAVDDDPGTCDYIKRLFERCKARCTTVTSGEKAVEEFSHAAEHYNICLVDWMMPKMDGLETIKRIRDIAGKDIPIIIISAYDFSEIADKADDIGVTMFVSKPLFQSSLFDILASISGDRLVQKEDRNEAFDFSGARILLAEDNMMNMEVAKRILESANLSIDCAWNGSEAVAMFNSAPAGTYSAILMDVHMPEMDGYQATTTIRASAHEDSVTIPIIAMTADAFAENVAEAYAAGMDDHIAKPIDVQVLFSTLKKFIGTNA